MSTSKKDIFLIIDGSALLHRAWHALPPLSTAGGEVINAVYGFTMMLMRLLKDVRPVAVAVAFDKKGPTFRHERYAAYKAQRKKQPPEFYAQFDRMREVLTAFGIPVLELNGYEADDVIATLSTNCADRKDIAVRIATGDLDALQLVNDQTHVLLFRKGITDMVECDQAAVIERYGGLVPEQLLQYKALRGDPSDNIPGVAGIGEKTAIELITEFGSIDAMYAALESAGEDSRIKKSVAEKLRVGKDAAYESLFLSRLVTDAPIECDIEKFRIGGYRPNEITALFHELEFKTLLPKLAELPSWPKQSASLGSSDSNYIILDSADRITAFLQELSACSEFACDTETTDLNVIDAEMVGMSFSWKAHHAWYVPWNGMTETQRATLARILENPAQKKICHNGKYDIEVLRGAGIFLQGLSFDTMIAAYVLNPGVREYTLDTLSFSELDHEKIPIESLIGSGKNQLSMADVPLPAIGRYACEDADCTWRLYEIYAPQLEKANLEKLFLEIEMPVIETLVEMEVNGVALDTDALKKLEKKVASAIADSAQEIYALAGEEFNIASPIQLKKILFDKLSISTSRIRKGKTGLSTAASELEKMRGSHPIIDCIFEYRELTKLQSTYIAVLPKLVQKKTGRIHTSFNQTIAATGRLSSSNPNIQNIPIRNSLATDIRKAFIAEGGYALLAADYSQIELRIIAALARDEKMIEAFVEGRDIHAVTAAEINGVSLSDVTPQMRRAAKEVNFGILYGMGPQGLAESAGISYGEAAQFIDQYFAAYPSIRAYIDETIAQAHTQGYVETIFGRRRYVPEINSSMVRVRNAAERMAINMPVQGTAADIMKRAMVVAYKEIIGDEARLSVQEKSVRMIMQVHDELVLEVREERVADVASALKRVMEGAAALAVPLVVELKTGKNWGEMIPLS